MPSADARRTTSPKRVVLVASELLGITRNGGLGTATTMLATFLARVGHEVEILSIKPLPAEGIAPAWTATYSDERIRVRAVALLGHGVLPTDARQGLEVLQALSTDPPDMVVVQDLGGPAHAAIRLKALGLGFGGTTFVVYCHGTHRWTKEAGNALGRDLASFESELAERYSVEHADVLVSPSAYMLDWMRDRGWRLPPATEVIPILTWSVATGKPPVRSAPRADAVTRLAFFGRLEERKGIALYLDALALLEPGLLEPVELVFMGSETKQWSSDRIRETLGSRGVRPRALLIEPRLDRDEAMSRLLLPGTLAVMPSLVDNSPNTISECLELGVPFLTTATGGGPELIDAGDRARATARPTTRDLAAALQQALTTTPRPVASAINAAAVTEAWRAIVDECTPSRPSGRASDDDAACSLTIAVVHDPSAGGNLTSCLAALERARARAGKSIDSEIAIVERGDADATLLSRPPADGIALAHVPSGTPWECRLAVAEGSARPWLVVLESDDLAEADMLESLVEAQRHTGADAVTCGVRHSVEGDEVIRVFSGEPGSLGLFENRYGAVGLVRREFVVEFGARAIGDEPFADPDWPFYAFLSCRGAAIATVPISLVTRGPRSTDAQPTPSDMLKVARIFEQHAAGPLSALPTIAAVLHRPDLQGRRPTP